MPTSMTGFGRGIVDGKRGRYVVEARSLNNRFLEVRVHAPKDLFELEFDVACRVKQLFARGKFDLVLKMVRLGGKVTNHIEEDLLIRTWKTMDRIRKRLGLAQPVSLESAWSLVTNCIEEEKLSQEASKCFLKACEEALAKLQRSREKEGQVLAKDMVERTNRLANEVQTISQITGRQGPEHMEKLQRRISELLSNTSLDPKRLELELAILVERSDVSEEIVRLTAHVNRLKEMLASQVHIGRELDFLLQEMNREINTIGSKADDLSITDYVIAVKSEIERIREQAQNLE